MTDALHAGQERVTEMYNYYMGVMFPVYSVQCGYDMANVSVAMSNIMNEDSIWAGLSKFIVDVVHRTLQLKKHIHSKTQLRINI